MAEQQKTFNEMLAAEPDQSQAAYITNGQIIVFKDIVSIEDKTFDFPERQVKRKIYKKSNGEEIVVPIIVHVNIKKLNKELGDKLQSVKILIDGQGKQKRYTVIPLV